MKLIAEHRRKMRKIVENVENHQEMWKIIGSAENCRKICKIVEKCGKSSENGQSHLKLKCDRVANHQKKLPIAAKCRKS